MPDLVTHFYFGRKVYEQLDEEIKQHIADPKIFDFTSAGPDPFFFYKYLKSKENKKIREFGNYMHRNKTREFYLELVEQVKMSKYQDELFSYLTGFITHYALDSVAHPYIFYSTGEYLSTPETLHWRGLHTKLERAIDSYIIRNFYNKVPWKFKISKEVLTLKQMPDALKEDLDAFYKKVFALDNAYDIIARTVKDQISFYNFINDRTGFKNWLFKIIDNKKGGIDFSKLSYYHKEINDADILNTAHQEWINPVDETIKSTESFEDLFLRAKEEALELIKVVYRVIYLNEEIDLSNYFKNLSYLTGVDCSRLDKDDMKNFKNIFE